MFFWNHFFLKRQLQRALSRGELIFFYQPQWHLQTGQITGVEALMRWRRNGTIVPPNDFIPKWEQAGLLPLLTSFLFNQTLSDLKQIHAAGFPDITVSVNLSVSQLNSKLEGTIEYALQQTGLPGKVLECELTETMPIASKAKEAVFNNLADLGITLILDDFGKGHATTHNLLMLKVRRIKLDQIFISDEPNPQAIDFIKMAHNFDTTVLAEGIETSQQADWLRHAGADFGQGFLLSKPLPLPNLIAFLIRTKTHEKKTGIAGTGRLS